MANDTVCMNATDSNTCVSDFCFFLIDSEAGLNNDAGILGLGPPYEHNGPSFYKSLYSQYSAEEWSPIASWHLAQNPNESYVDFGTYDPEYVVGDMIAHNITNEASWWELNLTGTTYAGYSIYTGTRHIIVDTGTSLLTLT